MTTLNAQLTAVNESFSIALADKVRSLKANGTPVIALQTGDPDFATPQPIIDAANRAMIDGHTHYSDSRGLMMLREAIAGKVQQMTGTTINPATDLLVTSGAVHAYYTGLQAIMNPGDTVLIPDPSWQTHANMVRVLRGVPLRVPSTADTGFMPDLDAWERALDSRTVAIVVNTPNNPTGSVAPRDYLQQLVDFAHRHDLYIIADEVYDHLVYDDAEHVSLLSLDGAAERTLLLNSFSKTYAMTGWRVGYLAAPASIINQALKASQHSITNLAAFIQYAAHEALTSPEVQAAVDDMIAAYTRRRRRVMEIAAAHPDNPVRTTPPQGAFYYWLDATALPLSAEEIASRLLEEARVAVVPGSAYGACGEGYLRMTIAASIDDVERGFTTLLDWAAAQVR